MLKKLTCLLLILALFLTACAPAVSNPDGTGQSNSTQESTPDYSNSQNNNDTNQNDDNAQEAAALAELAEYLKVEDLSLYEAYARREHCDTFSFIFFKEGNHYSDYDGYSGKPFSVEDMVHRGMYMVDDGTVIPLVAKYVTDFFHTSEYLYYVLQEAPRQVWRTDYYGKSHELVYESTYGDVIQVQHFGKVADEKLFVLENNNRVAVYDMVTQKVTVLLEAYYINQFYYSPSSLLFEAAIAKFVGKGEHGPTIFWQGVIREGVPVEGFGYNTYYSLLLKKQHWII